MAMPRLPKEGLVMAFAKCTAIMGIISVLGLSICGCNKDATSTNAFQSAGPDRKAVWVAATSAMNANDYLGAITNLDSLLTQTDLSAEQHKAVGAAEDTIRKRMYTAAEKGDTNANEAIEVLRQARMR
jgi:hypothetical protein